MEDESKLERILDGDLGPTDLQLSLFKKITNNFSKENKISGGGFGTVYKVLRRWRHRWKKPPTPEQYQQVTGCIDIAVSCREHDPKARPSIKRIMELLSESTDGRTGQISPRFDEDDMLGITPLELRLPCELKEEKLCSIELTNHTHNCIAFNIQPPIRQWYNSNSTQPDNGIVRSKSTYVLNITVQARDVHEQHNPNKFIVQSTTVGDTFRVEDITASLFHAEVGKVVDEVDLMVLYEPTKPHENCKRKHTNMPAEQVPEAKQRRLVESASGKGKNKLGSNEKAEASSMDIIILHPLQSFARHCPTNKKYLGEKSPAVDHARGAMGSLLDKLGKLVTEEYNLEERMKREIEYFSEDLANIHKDLPKLKRLDGIKLWVDEVRELSYHIEDIVDSFLVQVKPNSSRSSFQELKHNGLKLRENGMTLHHQIDSEIKYIKKEVKAVTDRQKNYTSVVKNVDANATAKAEDGNVPKEPDIGILRKSPIEAEDREELVGIEEQRDEVKILLQEDGSVSKENLRVVSIVGMGGLGKTTLAKVVYDELKGYRPKYFVSLGQNADVVTILRKIIIDCEREEYNGTQREIHIAKRIKELEELDEQKIITTLTKFLEDKRYVIVIDDIWDIESRDSISSAFPTNEHGSIVITTSRDGEVVGIKPLNVEKKVHQIKPLGDEDSRRLFFRRTLGPGKDCPDTLREKEISKVILQRCGGMPLAINSIASLLAGQIESTWEYVWKSMNAMSEGDGLEIMKQILDLSYIHLPDHLKACLLYVCMYPEDREIDKNDLLRQWVAEGLVSRNGLVDAVDVAEEYFKRLINMRMIQPGRIDYNNEVLSCRVHDIILGFMRSKSSKENFIHVIGGSEVVSGQIRRVSVQSNNKKDTKILETTKGPLEHVRSVLLCQGSVLPYILKYKYVRVLHLEHKAYSEGLDLTAIGMLFLLRYLKIACSRYSDCELKLPDKIGELQQLETIDLQGGELKSYPSNIVSLPWLSHLSYSGRGIALPDHVGRLISLRTLEGVCVYRSSVKNIDGLSKLTNLRKLQISSYQQSELKKAIAARMLAFRSSIDKLSGTLEILNLGKRSIIKLDVSSWRKISLFPKDSRIRELDLGHCNFKTCPEWISTLGHLYKLRIMVEKAEGVSVVVANLPSLAYLELYTGTEGKEERVVIPGSQGTFKALRHLRFHCPKVSLTIEAGAMPKLEKLDIFAYLELYTGTEGKEERVVIPGSQGTFNALRHLRFHCPKASLTIEAGAMPKLEKLDILFRYHMAPQFLPAGIKHFPADTLKEISLRMDEKRLDSITSDRAQDEQVRRFRTMMKNAFKEHYHTADIVLYFKDNVGDQGEDKEDYKSVDDEKKRLM